ncbi:rRNA-processing protein UTP23 homolog isoform X2 [Neltuma alba]|uniref:rRNA-processing protein UTP23 homolog isoform X2 n=1 Tax=Neltuma alba TaxID=207710 RepID=UPI0010A573CC|nr:rRNA-processing protein UTP23 homolog isoform X2 [Prosopis alba]
MKVNKLKRHRKSLTFYSSCCGFRKPFKVLCDGNFVHHLIQNKITPADNSLANILNSDVKLFTTRCVLEELKRLGRSFAESLEAARQLKIARCEHEKCEHAAKCIMDVVGENNSQHFFVGSQDTELRRKLQQVPGVPLIYGLRNALFLEPVSAFQREFVKTSEEARSHITDREYKMLTNRLQSTSNDEEAANSADEEKDLGDQTKDVKPVKKNRSSARNQMGVKDRPQFKRKKAKVNSL